MSALDAERRSRLLGTKLQVLAREQLGIEGAPAPFPGGAAMAVDGRAVVLAQDAPARALGPALAWARQAGADALDLLVEDAAGHLARRAATFARPPTVWWVQGRELHAVEAEPLPKPLPPPPGALDAAAELRAAGADVVVEHGTVSGEVLGLEIARVVDGRVEVGIGRHDREAFAMVHGDLPTREAVAKVIDTVRRARRGGDTDHPLKRLAQERWLREILLTRPDVVGLDVGALERHEGPHPRPSVKEPWPAVAVGAGVVVVCSVGIDLDLVPFAADARVAVDPAARLVLVVPERDDHPVTRALAAALREPADVVPVPGAWQELA